MLLMPKETALKYCSCDFSSQASTTNSCGMLQARTIPAQVVRTFVSTTVQRLRSCVRCIQEYRVYRKDTSMSCLVSTLPWNSTETLRYLRTVERTIDQTVAVTVRPLDSHVFNVIGSMLTVDAESCLSTTIVLVSKRNRMSS